jgi:hypothetical protein
VAEPQRGRSRRDSPRLDRGGCYQQLTWEIVLGTGAGARRRQDVRIAFSPVGVDLARSPGAVACRPGDHAARSGVAATPVRVWGYAAPIRIRVSVSD